MSERGSTKNNIIAAATKVFFQHGYEATSIKMILEEAQIVTGSFYHFFASKEALFECVVEKYLQSYTQNVCNILNDESLNVLQIFQRFFVELKNASKEYYEVLQGDKLHWSVQYALHIKTLEALVVPVANLLTRLINNGTIKSRLSVDNLTLSKVLINGTEAILHGGKKVTDYFEADVVKGQVMEFVNSILEISAK